MTQTSFAILTNIGLSKEAAAMASGTPIEITHIAIGDGATVPSGGETALYNQTEIKTISGSGTVVGAANVAYFDAFLAANEGPFTIREAGLFDADGDLIAIAHYDPPINKPIPDSGQTVEGTVRLEVAFSNLANIVISIDPTMLVPLQRLTVLPWIPIISKTTATPPADPALGDTYVIPASATGAWSGQTGMVAEYTAAGWAIMEPADGHGIGLPDGSIWRRISGVYVKDGQVAQAITKSAFTYSPLAQDQLAIAIRSQRLNYVQSGGTASALTGDLTIAPATYLDISGVPLLLQTGASPNPGDATLNLNGLGAIPIKRMDAANLQPGDLPAVSIIPIVFDGSVFRNMIAGGPNAKSSGQVIWKVAGTYSWTVPAGVYSILVEVWGAGGGGGGANSGSVPSAGAGGGGGGYARKYIPVTPGQVIPIVVGAGGSIGISGIIHGGAGGTSSVAGSVVAPGGSGGLSAQDAFAAGGTAGGVPTTGDVNIPGNAGGGGIDTGGSPVSGAGGGAYGFPGWGSGNQGTPGSTGPQPGTGGNGGASAAGTGITVGGAGAPGYVTITY